MNDNEKYPYGCPLLKKSDFKRYSGLSEVCRFNKVDILNEQNVKKIGDEIKNKNMDNKVWALLGGNVENEWICLQVASATNMANEIIFAIKCMLPLTKKDTKSWNSKFHNNVFEVHYGLDVRCQKYRNMYSRFQKFCIVLITPEEYVNDISIEKRDLVKYAEVKYAYDTQALYWNPFGKEHRFLDKIINHIENKKNNL